MAANPTPQEAPSLDHGVESRRPKVPPLHRKNRKGNPRRMVRASYLEAYLRSMTSRCHLSVGEPPDNQVTVASRRGWQTVLVEASGISAAISEENMKRLKYCLQWLQVRMFRYSDNAPHPDAAILSMQQRVSINK